MTNQPETELERSAREVVRAWFDGLRGPVMAQYINKLDAALRERTSAFQVCPYSHDHPRGDPSYDDCVAAYEDAPPARPPAVAWPGDAAATAARRTAADALRSRVLDTTVIQGHRYRVEYREAGKRNNREMIVDYLSETDSYWFFHGDNDFGTVQIRKEDTVRISEVPKTDKIMRPRPVRLKPTAGQRRAMGHTFVP